MHGQQRHGESTGTEERPGFGANLVQRVGRVRKVVSLENLFGPVADRGHLTLLRSMRTRDALSFIEGA